MTILSYTKLNVECKFLPHTTVMSTTSRLQATPTPFTEENYSR